MIIVVIVLLIFMGWRSAAIVGASLLLTILFTLIYLNLTQVDLQRVSLGSFILALGMLVITPSSSSISLRPNCVRGLPAIRR